MANYSYTPTSQLSGRINAIFGNMIQGYVNNGQILPHVQQWMINEFNMKFPQIVQLIFNKSPLGQEPTDAQIQQYLTSIINQMMNNFNTAQQRAMYTPQFNNGVVVQPQAYNPMLMGGGVQQTTSLFTGQAPNPVPSQGSFYSNPGIVTPPQPVQQPMNSGLVTPPAQTMSAKETRENQRLARELIEKTDVGAVIYNPPVFYQNTEEGRSGSDVDLGWGSGNVKQFMDADTNEEIDLAQVDIDRGYVCPKQAAEATMSAMRNVLSNEKFVSVNYNQLQAYEVPRSTSEDVINKLKDMAKTSPHNSKYAYLKNMQSILGSVRKDLSDKLEGIFILEFNMAAMHGALFDSNIDVSEGSFKINSLKELLSYLDPDEVVDAKAEKIRSKAGFRDRLNTVARSTILRTIQDIRLSDPNTPEGLEDYIAVYGDVLVDNKPIKDIARYREMSLHTDSKGEKTKQALEAMKIYQGMVEQLMKYSVVRIAGKNVVFTTLPLNGMIQPNFTYKCDPQDLGGPGSASSHCEHFLMMTKNRDPRVFTIFFQPNSNVLISYIGVRTSDDWIRMMPVRMM